LRPVKRRHSPFTIRNRSFNHMKTESRMGSAGGLEEGLGVCCEVRNENGVGNVDGCIPLEPITPRTARNKCMSRFASAEPMAQCPQERMIESMAKEDAK